MNKGQIQEKTLKYVKRSRTPYSRFMYMETSKKLLLIVTSFWMITVSFAIYSAMYLGVDLTPVLSYVSTAFMVEVTAYSAKAGYEKRYQYPDINVEEYVDQEKINNNITIDTATIDK